MPNNNQKQIFSNNLKLLLQNSGQSQTDFAAKLGVEQTTVSDWINAKTLPTNDMLQLIADYFGVVVEKIVN